MSELQRDWSIEELRVLAAIFFNSSFSIGDDQRDECRSIADCFGRTPSSVDRQWRNMAAVVKGIGGYNVGALVKQSVADYLDNPAASKTLALSICRQQQWPLESLVAHGRQVPMEPSAPGDLQTQIERGIGDLCDRLEYRSFSSGSQGFFKQGKILAEGTRYQAQVSVVLIGSKRDSSMTVRASVEDLSFAIAPLIDQLEARRFRTGRVGFYVTGRVSVGSERYQVGLQAVRIGEQ